MPVDQAYGKATTWRQAKLLHVKVGGAWQRVKSAWVKVSGAWQQVYGDALSLTASGSVNGANNWTFSYGVFVDGGNTIPGGGAGAEVTVETEIGGIIAATYPDPAGAGNTAVVTTDETASYVARLYDKAGAEVDSVTFTPA